MSRRQAKHQGSMLLLLCTGRSTHGRRVLAEVRYMVASEGPGLLGLEVETRKGSGKSYMRFDAGRLQGAYALQCPSCRRDVRLSFDRLNAVAEGAVAAGFDALDVSNF